MVHFADRLMEAIDRKGAPICVGLDPVFERLPFISPETSTTASMEERAEAMETFCLKILDITAPKAPAVKINIAFFEPYHEAGIRAYRRVVAQARQAGLIVIGDVKRGDIDHTARHYALAQLSDSGSDRPAPDAVTVNPYFGLDGVAPFLDVASREGKGVFVLVQTSNPGASQIQGLALRDGRTVGQAVAELVQAWATQEGRLGACGYSCVGAVVAPNDPAETARLRAVMSDVIFLAPGFGAQGRTARQAWSCFKEDGRGALVTVSRGVIFAHENPAYRRRFGGDWEKCVRRACEDFIEALQSEVR